MRCDENIREYESFKMQCHKCRLKDDEKQYSIILNKLRYKILDQSRIFVQYCLSQFS